MFRLTVVSCGTLSHERVGSECIACTGGFQTAPAFFGTNCLELALDCAAVLPGMHEYSNSGHLLCLSAVQIVSNRIAGSDWISYWRTGAFYASPSLQRSMHALKKAPTPFPKVGALTPLDPQNASLCQFQVVCPRKRVPVVQARPRLRYGGGTHIFTAGSQALAPATPYLTSDNNTYEFVSWQSVTCRSIADPRR